MNKKFYDKIKLVTISIANHQIECAEAADNNPEDSTYKAFLEGAEAAYMQSFDYLSDILNYYIHKEKDESRKKRPNPVPRSRRQRPPRKGK